MSRTVEALYPYRFWITFIPQVFILVQAARNAYDGVTVLTIYSIESIALLCISFFYIALVKKSKGPENVDRAEQIFAQQSNPIAFFLIALPVFMIGTTVMLATYATVIGGGTVSSPLDYSGAGMNALLVVLRTPSVYWLSLSSTVGVALGMFGVSPSDPQGRQSAIFRSLGRMFIIMLCVPLFIAVGRAHQTMAAVTIVVLTILATLFTLAQGKSFFAGKIKVG